MGDFLSPLSGDRGWALGHGQESCYLGALRRQADMQLGTRDMLTLAPHMLISCYIHYVH